MFLMLIFLKEAEKSLIFSLVYVLVLKLLIFYKLHNWYFIEQEKKTEKVELKRDCEKPRKKLFCEILNVFQSYQTKKSSLFTAKFKYYKQ